MTIPAKLAQFIGKAGKIDETSDKFANMLYMLEVLYANTWKTVLLFWLAALFGIWRELIGSKW